MHVAGGRGEDIREPDPFEGVREIDVYFINNGNGL